jgi:hypothetical protein
VNRYEVGDSSEKAKWWAKFFGLQSFDAEAYDLYNEYMWDEEGWLTAQLISPSNWEFINGRVT